MKACSAMTQAQASRDVVREIGIKFERKRNPHIKRRVRGWNLGNLSSHLQPRPECHKSLIGTDNPQKDLDILDREPPTPCDATSLLSEYTPLEHLVYATNGLIPDTRVQCSLLELGVCNEEWDVRFRATRSTLMQCLRRSNPWCVLNSFLHV